jgi:hypothetical protein
MELLEARQLLATFTANLVPLNNSGVSGTANITLEGNRLTVTINATGLEANQIHPQHIHGRFATGNSGTARDSVAPTATNDADRDGFIEAAEAATSTGPAILPLSSPPANDAAPDPAGSVKYPTVGADGKLTFTQEYDVSNATQFFDPENKLDFSGQDVQPLPFRVIELHGLTVKATDGTGTTGEVNGSAGYKANLPVAVGEIVAADGGGGGGGGGGTTGVDGIFSPPSGTTGQVTLPADYTFREARFENEVGFFLTDASGAVNGIAPGQPGWAQAALNSSSRQILFARGARPGANARPTFNAGDNVVFYIIQDDTTANFLSRNPQNQVGSGPLAFFSVAGANPDTRAHVRFSSATDNSGNTTFSWEDLTNLGDSDFNDVVFTIGLVNDGSSTGTGGGGTGGGGTGTGGGGGGGTPLSLHDRHRRLSHKTSGGAVRW